MRVVLTKSVPKLGKAGEVKEVAPGFFRNFLSSRGLATLATRRALKEAQRLRLGAEQHAAQEFRNAQELAKKLDGLELLFQLRTDPHGEAYGSVNAEMIREQLQKLGYPLERQNIQIEEPIRTIGEHPVKVELGHGVEVKVRVVVESF